MGLYEIYFIVNWRVTQSALIGFLSASAFLFWRQRSAEYIPKEGVAGKADFKPLDS